MFYCNLEKLMMLKYLTHSPTHPLTHSALRGARMILVLDLPTDINSEGSRDPRSNHKVPPTSLSHQATLPQSGMSESPAGCAFSRAPRWHLVPHGDICGEGSFTKDMLERSHASFHVESVSRDAERNRASA